MVDKNRTPVAKDVMSYCTKCKIMTNHVVTAHVDGYVAKVKCHECGSLHKYRDQPPATRKKSTTKKQKEEGASLAEYNELMKSYGDGEQIEYSISRPFAVNDIVLHTKFGKGIVTRLFFKKMEVLFETGLRTLVCNRG